METKSIVSHIPTFTAGVLVLCIASSKIAIIASLFVYDRVAILRGELWRLVTSHFVHFNDIHLIYNLIAFGVIGWIIEYKGYRYFKFLCLLMACSISAVMIVLKPDMSFFGGLSGIVCGAIAYCSLQCLLAKTPWRTISIFTIIFLFVKVGLEIYNSGSLLPYWGTHDFIPIPLSHITGIFIAFIFFFLREALAQLVPDLRDRLSVFQFEDFMDNRDTSRRLKHLDPIAGLDLGTDIGDRNGFGKHQSRGRSLQ